MSYNPATSIAGQAQDAATDSTAFQRIFTAEAPMMNYIGTKGPCKIIVLPPPASFADAVHTLTAGIFIQDPTKKGGTMPIFGDYALDWCFVYKGIGVSRKMDVLAAIWEENDELPGGGRFVVEQSWGRNYKSPMYELQEYLWKASGSPKFQTRSNRREPTTDVLDSRAIDLLPYGNDLTAPMRPATRTMFIQGLVVENYGVNFLQDEEGRPQWPQQRILQINQNTAIKTKHDVIPKEGIYDALLMPTGNRSFDDIAEGHDASAYIDDEQARRQWENVNFVHANFGTVPKLLTISHYESGPASITTYKANVTDVASVMDPGYANLPTQITDNLAPVSSYLVKMTRKDQIELLQELFAGYEWALINAGLISGGSTMVQGAQLGYAPHEAQQLPAQPPPPPNVQQPSVQYSPPPSQATPVNQGVPYTNTAQPPQAQRSLNTPPMQQPPVGQQAPIQPPVSTTFSPPPAQSSSSQNVPQDVTVGEDMENLINQLAGNTPTQ